MVKKMNCSNFCHATTEIIICPYDAAEQCLPLETCNTRRLECQVDQVQLDLPSQAVSMRLGRCAK